jgi:hypothetical protein
MEKININDRVQITKTNPGEEYFHDKVGFVAMIMEMADGDDLYFVQCPDGSGREFRFQQLKKLARR